MGFSVRKAVESDAAQLLELMKALASFEGYRDQFVVTEDDLIERGLGTNSSGQFVAFVAENELGELCGYAVTYGIPYTYDLKPTLVLKELFVTQNARGKDMGRALMDQVVAHAKTMRSARLKWDVLPCNERAKAFYRRFGGAPNADWEAWTLVFDSASKLRSNEQHSC